MLTEAITSFFDGRIRFRHALLRDPATALRVRDFLMGLPGVRGVEMNSRTGSALFTYDPVILDRKTLLGLAAQAERFLAVGQAEGTAKEQRSQSMGEKRPACRTPEGAWGRRVINRGMLASLTASVAFGLLGRNGLHILFGGIFLAFNSAHIYSFRKLL